MDTATIIKTHKDLSKAIQGKRILHMNSLGKDSVLCLEWLVSYAKIKEIISVYFELHAKHPGDEVYLKYLKKRFPTVKFVKLPNTVELTNICLGIYQSPLDINYKYNHFEYDGFDMGMVVDELMKEYFCDYACDGASKYEDFSRRTKFHQKGLMFKNKIYPLGMMSKAEVIGLLKSTGLKIHPSYKTAGSTYDHPSYWKMRSAFITNPQYYNNVKKIYPLICLDKYRYEKLLKDKNEKAKN
jgi:hypothetical protein